jgi:hypothetical protein
MVPPPTCQTSATPLGCHQLKATEAFMKKILLVDDSKAALVGRRPPLGLAFWKQRTGKPLLVAEC